MHGVAMVAFYSEPDAEIRTASQDKLWVCQRARAQDYQLIDIQNIQSVVAMIPFPLSHAELNNPEIKVKYSESFYVAEKLFLPISQLSTPEQELESLESIEDDGNENNSSTTDEEGHSQSGSIDNYSDSGGSDRGSDETGCNSDEETI